MIFRGFLTIAAVVCGIGGAFAQPRPTKPVKPVSGDEVFLRAYDAFRAGDAFRLQKAGALPAGHVLAPYPEYWRLKLRLEDAPDADVLAFLEAQPGTYLADRLRADWLKVLGKRADWQTFDRELPPLLNDDLEIRCYAWMSRLMRGDASANDEARAVWQEPRELPEGCHALANKVSEAGRFTTDDVWRRVRLLLENGQVSAARRALGHLPAAEKHDEALLNQAATAPKKLLVNPPKSLERRATREMVLFAVVRRARTEPESAADVLKGSLGKALPDEDMKYLWGRVA